MSAWVVRGTVVGVAVPDRLRWFSYPTGRPGAVLLTRHFRAQQVRCHCRTTAGRGVWNRLGSHAHPGESGSPLRRHNLYRQAETGTQGSGKGATRIHQPHAGEKRWAISPRGYRLRCAGQRAEVVHCLQDGVERPSW